MQRRPPVISRRRVLSGAAALAILGTAAATSTACGTSAPPPDLDDLSTALVRARADSRLAAEAAAGARAPVLHALNEVAAERSAHAEAIAEEIERMTGSAAPTTTTSTSETSATSATSAAAGPKPTVKDVIDALRGSADSAAQTAATLSGYRAGLLGSVAAACTAAYLVALAPREGTP